MDEADAMQGEEMTIDEIVAAAKAEARRTADGEDWCASGYGSSYMETCIRFYEAGRAGTVPREWERFGRLGTGPER